MKQILKRVLKFLVITCAILILFSVFVYCQGLQYTLALLTGSLRDPNFDSAQYEPASNCYGERPCTGDVIRVLTYNVFCRICSQEGDDPWDVRVTHLRRLVDRYDPDLIGSQELGGWKDMQEYLPEGDEYATVTFQFGPWTYGDAALFYRRSRYELLDSGQFWLSPNPGLPFGFSWLKLSAPRYLAWACLRDLHTGFTFLFMNTHMDNNTQNKETSAPVIYDAFRAHAQRLPIIFTGDFNTNPTTQRYTRLQQGNEGTLVFHNTADIAKNREVQVYQQGSDEPDSTSTFTRFEHMIDHIFVAGPASNEVLRWVVDENLYGEPQRQASDHPALYAELRMTL